MEWELDGEFWINGFIGFLVNVFGVLLKIVILYGCIKVFKVVGELFFVMFVIILRLDFCRS